MLQVVITKTCKFHAYWWFWSKEFMCAWLLTLGHFG